MLKTYTQFLFEMDLDLGLGGGEDKKGKEQKPPDPEKEIRKAKEKKRKKAAKERAEELDAAEADIKDALKNVDPGFLKKFEKRIKDALDDDDRVTYHNLILDIQRYQMPLAASNQEDRVAEEGPIIKVLKRLNKNEYKG